MIRTLSESTGVVEVAQNLRARFTTISENLSIAATLDYRKTLIRVISEALSLSEAEHHVAGFVRVISEAVDISHFTGRLRREGFVRIRKIAKLFGRGKSVKTYKRGHSIKGADR